MDDTPAKTPRRSSNPKDSESRSSKEADPKSAASMSSAKRRSTMNSRRDMEEEEMLRKAIEQSKSDGGSGINGKGHRRSKRGREEDTDEYVFDTLRYRALADRMSLLDLETASKDKRPDRSRSPHRHNALTLPTIHQRTMVRPAGEADQTRIRRNQEMLQRRLNVKESFVKRRRNANMKDKMRLDDEEAERIGDVLTVSHDDYFTLDCSDHFADKFDRV